MVKLTDIIPGPHQVVPERDALFNVSQYEEIKNNLIMSKILTVKLLDKCAILLPCELLRVVVCSDCVLLVYYYLKHIIKAKQKIWAVFLKNNSFISPLCNQKNSIYTTSVLFDTNKTFPEHGYWVRC